MDTALDLCIEFSVKITCLHFYKFCNFFVEDIFLDSCAGAIVLFLPKKSKSAKNYTQSMRYITRQFWPPQVDTKFHVSISFFTIYRTLVPPRRELGTNQYGLFLDACSLRFGSVWRILISKCIKTAFKTGGEFCLMMLPFPKRPSSDRWTPRCIVVLQG